MSEHIERMSEHMERIKDEFVIDINEDGATSIEHNHECSWNKPAPYCTIDELINMAEEHLAEVHP